ncbi:MAG: hypothetical protein ABI707_07060 [Ferruginibacter sp.]
MKKICTFLCGIFLLINNKSVTAQNVGIGTTNPQTTLDVRGNLHLGGGSNYLSYDSLSGKIIWSNSYLFVPVNQYLLQHSASAEGIYYNSGQLEYRNQLGIPVFFTNWINGNGYFRGNLGVNNITPQFPLSFNGSLGDKISLWTDGTATHYGLGVQSGLLQIFSKTNVDDIGFGYGSSTAFTERMRIKGNGNVGIGTTNPTEKLVVSGNIQASTFKYSSPKTFYYSVNEAAFRPRNSAETVISGLGNGGTYISNGSFYGLTAPVNLPQNATVTQITVHFYDASATQDLTAILSKESTSGYSDLASINSTGNAGLNIQNYMLPTPVTINNTSSSYEILVVPASGSWNTPDLAIRSVIIQYTMDETN